MAASIHSVLSHLYALKSNCDSDEGGMHYKGSVQSLISILPVFNAYYCCQCMICKFASIASQIGAVLPK
eukprot:scaffold33253_cov17-Prasinocladus_malaysianus.AAC.1